MTRDILTAAGRVTSQASADAIEALSMAADRATMEPTVELKVKVEHGRFGQRERSAVAAAHPHWLGHG